MVTYNFELTFKLNNDESGEHYLETLYEAGCDDALVGFGKQGYIGIEFSRDASNAYEAVSSAIRDVRTAIPHARLIEVGPDLVGLTDMATVFDVSRQYMRQLIVDNPTAPAPIHSGSPNLWSFYHVLAWMRANRLNIHGTEIEESVLELAGMARTVNIAKHFMVSIVPDQSSTEDTVRIAARELPSRIRKLMSEDDLRLIA